MALRRLIVLLAVLALVVGSLGLVGCSSSDDSADSSDSGESTSDEADSGQDAGPLMGDWENPDGVIFTDITFADGGEGTVRDPEGMETWMTWTLEDDYLEIAAETDDGTESTGAGFAWVEEGEEFEWDADGTYTKTR